MENNNKQEEKLFPRARTRRFHAGNQRGVALVLALVMLLVLGVIGALSVSQSNTEMRIAGNYRNNLIGFYNANTSEAFNLNNVVIQNFMNPYGSPQVRIMPTSPANQCPAPMVYVPPASGAATGGFCSAVPDNSILVQVEFLCMSKGLIKTPGTDVEFAGFHYAVTVVGRDATNAEYVTETEIVYRGQAPPGVEQDCIPIPI